MTTTALSARTLPQALIRMYCLFDWPEYDQRAVIGLEGLMVTHSWPADGDLRTREAWRAAVKEAAMWAAGQGVWASTVHTVRTAERVSYSVLVRLVVEDEE